MGNCTFVIYIWLLPYASLAWKCYFYCLERQNNNLLLKLADVESQLLALKNVSISTAGLAGAGGQAGVKTASSELVVKGGVDLGIILAGLNLALDVVRASLVKLLGLDLEWIKNGGRPVRYLLTIAFILMSSSAVP